MEHVQLMAIGAEDQEWVRAFFIEHWGGTQMVYSKGIHECDRLPGFVARIGEQIVGVITYAQSRDACEIVSLDSLCEGQGIGTKLITAVEQVARREKCIRVWLITTNDNLNALRFYQKRGYELVTVYRRAVEEARKIKPQIPAVGDHGIPIRDEVELEKWLDYSYDDYLQFPDDERWELIGGILYNMTPAPSTKHQRIVLDLARKFANYLEDKTCEVFVAPFDVRLLSEGKRDHEVKNVVQPDITVIFDTDKIDDKGCNGAPDLIVEVISPSTAKMDRAEKLKLYRRARVKEYWIVDPTNGTVEILKFNEDSLPATSVNNKEDVVKVGLFEDLEIDLQTVFR